LKKRGLREQYGRFLVEGAQAADEAVVAGVAEAVFHVAGATGRIPEVVERARAAGITVTEVSEAVMAHLTSAVTPQGIVAVARFVDVTLDELASDLGLVPVLCAVRDPGNAGAILRSADASGASGVVFSTSSVDVYNPKAVRASAGSLFHLPVVREAGAPEAVAALRGRGARILAAAPDGPRSLYEADLTGPVAVLFGNEAWGLRPEVRELADEAVRVPIEGRAESLNLAAAAALVLFEGARQRGSSTGLAGLVSAFAHDLRLPLTAVKGFAATLVDRWDAFDEPDRRVIVEGMLLDAERAAASVTMIVEAARLASGRFRPSAERREVAEVAGWAAALFDRASDYPPVRVSGAGEVAVETDRLRALLLALCDGAIWWGREGPIEIEITPDGRLVRVEVRRRGGGPDPDEAARVFDGPASPGSKVGLHVARLLAEAHGGGLTCQGGDGVRFVLVLPA
jgi:RNA methyltransferase, TrmH family